MANIVLSGDELVGILHANELVPSQVTAVETDGEEMTLKVQTPWPVLRSVRVGVRFAGFENGHVVFQLVTNRLIDTFEWLVKKMLESFRFSDYGGRWDYPRLHIDVNRLVGEQIRGVTVDDVAFVDGHFHVKTSHPVRIGADGDEPAADERSDTSCMPAQ